jgi:hypothetical protein
MTEQIDVYSDQFTVSVGPFGASLSFALSSAHPDPASPQPPQRIATIRTSVEHLKIMAIIINRHVKKIEGEMGVSYQVPIQLLAQMGISKQDWDDFWKNN